MRAKIKGGASDRNIAVSAEKRGPHKGYTLVRPSLFHFVILGWSKALQASFLPHGTRGKRGGRRCLQAGHSGKSGFNLMVTYMKKGIRS